MRKSISRLLCGCLVVSQLFGFCGPSKESVASKQNNWSVVKEKKISSGETATGSAVSDTCLRLIFTTDIHGQVLNYDYQNERFINRGLNLESTMIKEAKAEAGEGNYLTFDVGDSIMDVTTDRIYEYDSTMIQPVFQAIKLMNYDAITMGNHDFDYGYDYLMTQLRATELESKCVLSNVYSVNNFRPAIGSENKIITKKVTAPDGSSVEVKVGILGEVTPGLSAKTEAYKDKVFTEDIVANATKQVTALKEAGADIVVALSHSGFGEETPENKDANCTYALTRVPGLDVILAGHEHAQYPIETADSKHYRLSGVDPVTHLINGKRVIMVKDSCQGIGIADLHLKMSEGRPIIKSSDWEIRKPDENTVADPQITATMDGVNNLFREIYGDKIGNIKDGKNWNNYLLTVTNNDVMQAVHNMQIDYASRYIVNNQADYAGMPLVSLARYANYGDGKDYADIDKEIHVGDLKNMVDYHKYIYVYKITGAQLREWLEWSASVYQTANTSDSVNWNNVVESEYLKKKGRNMLISKSWEDNYSRCFEASGIEYTVNLNSPPRYDKNGYKINESYRVGFPTINGEIITDSREILVVTEKISASLQSDAVKGVTDNVVCKTHDVNQDLLASYLYRRAYMGDLSFNVNSDKTLLMPDDYEYMVVTGKGASERVMDYPDIKTLYAAYGDKEYFVCKRAPQSVMDDKNPTLYLSASNLEETNKAVNIRVYANDASGIAEIKYLFGNYDVNDEKWASAATVTDNTIKATTNGIYSVLARDLYGNKVVEKIPVVNINPAQLLAPKVDAIKNNMVNVKGTASANLNVHVLIGKKEYKGVVAKDGTFKVKIPVQEAKTIVKVYVSNSEGKQSSVVKSVVKRVAPNCPTYKKVTNQTELISGKTHDDNVNIYAVVASKVYVDNNDNGVKAYESCDAYDESKEIIKTDIDISKKGKYTIKIPAQNYGKVIKIFNIDNIGRVSRVRKKTIKKVSPNKPVVYDSYAGEKRIYGLVDNGTQDRIYIDIEGETKNKTIEKENGQFIIDVSKLDEGDVIKVYAKGKVGNKTKKSLTTEVTVKSLASELEKANTDIVLDELDNTVRNVGVKTASAGKITLINDSYYYYGSSDGSSKATVSAPMGFIANSKVYVIFRKNNGSYVSATQKDVLQVEPSKPFIDTSLNSNSTRVKVYAYEQCEVELRLGGASFTADSGRYDSSKKAFVYFFDIKKLKHYGNKKVKLSCSATNEVGTTEGKSVVIKL